MRVTLVLVLISGIPRALIGQRWEQQVQTRLVRAIDALPASSRLSVVKRSGTLNIDEGASFQTTLREGVSYAISRSVMMIARGSN